jgi:hypothetical protein
VVERRDLREGAAHRQPDEVRARQTKRVEQAHRVRDEVTAAIARCADRVVDRAASVAQVVADDEAPAGR